MEPAGGETGVPRCLAEVCKLLKAASFRYFRKQLKKTNYSKKTCQIKNEKTFWGIYPPNLHCHNKINIQVMTIKCKSKIAFFVFLRPSRYLSGNYKVKWLKYLRLLA